MCAVFILLLFAHVAIRQLGYWARCDIRRVGYWVNSDNSTKIRQKEHSSKMDSPRRDYLKLAFINDKHFGTD